MKKIVNIITIIAIVFSIFMPTIHAETIYGKVVGSNELNLRVGPGTNYGYANPGDVPGGTTLSILDTVDTNDGSTKCGSGKWYKVEYKSSVSYACSSFIQIITAEEEKSFEESLKDFPESYQSYLRLLHDKYPDWKFKAIKTGLDFWVAAGIESYGGKGLINTSNEGWRSTTEDSGYNWETDSWPGMDGASWKAASKDITAYYMDPRNFLNESGIFQFEELYYNPSISDSTVQFALKNTFMSGTYPYNGGSKSYSSTFLESGQINNVNPVFLVTRVKQEVGSNGSSSTSGKVAGYEGYYNFFNIGAYAYHYPGVSDPVINGLITAKNYGWNSPYKSITEGVGGTIINNYIKKEATTRYFFKYNVNPARWPYYSVYTFQYMTNIQDPSSESSSVYKSYKDANQLTGDSSFTFAIPVYENMPSKTEQPNKGNPNYYLKNLTIDGTTINGFTYNKADYNISVSASTASINIGATKINATGSIHGAGNIALTTGENKIPIVVTAGNGNTFTYHITITRAESDIDAIPLETILDHSGVKYNDKYMSGIQIGTNVSSLINNVKKASPTAYIKITDANGTTKTDAAFKTGDKVVITSGDETKEFQIVIYGDIDGNGEIGRTDLQLMQRDVFGYSKLSGVYAEAADIDKKKDENGNKVGRTDLQLLQRDVFGYSSIVQ